MTAPVDTRPPVSTAVPGLRDRYGLLLKIDDRDRSGLLWIKHRARMWLTALKRRRRYCVPRGAAYTEAEGQLIEVLADLESAAGRLLTLVDDDTT